MKMETDMLLVSVLLRIVAREHPEGVEADMREVLA
jgi:hypothetical protein